MGGPVKGPKTTTQQSKPVSKDDHSYSSGRKPVTSTFTQKTMILKLKLRHILLFIQVTFLRNATFVKTCIVLNVPKLNQKKPIKHLAQTMMECYGLTFVIIAE